MALSPNLLPEAYRQMFIIRKFEDAIRDLYQQRPTQRFLPPLRWAGSYGGWWLLDSDKR